MEQKIIEELQRSIMKQAEMIVETADIHARFVKDLPYIVMEIIGGMHNKRKPVHIVEVRGRLHAVCDDGTMWAFLHDTENVLALEYLKESKSNDLNDLGGWRQIKEIPEMDS